jgi:uncharacterized protein YqgC (DUF456 family)
MVDLAPLLLLACAFLFGLLLVPFGLPGLWVMVLTLVGYAALGDFQRVGWVSISLVLGLALLGEVLEAIFGFRLAMRYGAGKRAGWGALIGGLVGAVVGTPLPIIGNIAGAFLGAFLGAALFQYTAAPDVRGSMSAGWGAILGKAAGAATKMALGLMIAIIGLYAAWA